MADDSKNSLEPNNDTSKDNDEIIKEAQDNLIEQDKEESIQTSTESTDENIGKELSNDQPIQSDVIDIDDINNKELLEQGLRQANSLDIDSLYENDKLLNSSIFANADPNNNPNFEDDIDLNKEINIEDIEKLQAKIQETMIREFSEFAPDDDDDDSVLKKYLVYVSKDFVPILDNLSTNEMSAYINDAIQKKIDIEDEQKQKQRKKRIIAHIVVAFFTVLFSTPFLLYAAHKSIMATFDNYKYSQENFEKLYTQRFKKDKVYVRSLKYNKIHKTQSKPQQE